MLDIYEFELEDYYELPHKMRTVGGLRGIPNVVYCNFAWQTGDFAHFYAAIISDLYNGTDQILLLIPSDKAELPIAIAADIEFALANICSDLGRTVNVVFLKNLNRFKITRNGFWSDVLQLTVYGPTDATKRASGFVKAMRPGDTLSPVWASLIRGEHAPGLSIAYAEACQMFSKEFFSGKKFPKDLSSRAKFVCIWGREVPVKGGANPHYNSSKFGNDQICCSLVAQIPDLSAVLIVGTEHSNTMSFRPKTFLMGPFWEKLPDINGRLMQNAFFQYMTTTYSCDVVHVGMKSGGMDSLAMLGQKVVFIDYARTPQITRERVEHLRTGRFRYVEVNQLPSSIGKLIDKMRSEDDLANREHRIKTTISGSKLAKELEAEANRIDLNVDGFALYPGEHEHRKNSFEEDDLKKIVSAIQQMFG